MLSGLVVSIMFPGRIFTLTSPKMLCFRCALICNPKKGKIKLFTWKHTHKLWANNLQNSSIPAPAVITEILLVFFPWWWSCWYCTLCHLPQRFSLLERSLTQALLYQCIPSLWLLPSFLCFNTVPLLDSGFDGGTQRKNICYHNLQIEMWNCPYLNKHASSVWN